MWLRTYSIALVLLLAAAAAGQSPADADWAALDSQAARSYEAGDLPRAVELARQALSAATSSSHSGHSLDRLGFYLYISGDLPEGEQLLRQSHDLREHAFGAGSVDYAETANALAMLL